MGWCGFRPLIQSLEQLPSNPAHHPSLICEIKRAEFTLFVTFCCTIKWTNSMHVYFHSLMDLPPTPLSHPFRSLQSSELSVLHCTEGSYCCSETGWRWGEEFVPVKREKRGTGCSEKERKRGMSFFLSLSWKQRWIYSEQAWTFLVFLFVCFFTLTAPNSGCLWLFAFLPPNSAGATFHSYCPLLTLTTLPSPCSYISERRLQRHRTARLNY